MGLEVHVHVWTTCFNDYIKVYLHVLMMRRKEERSKQGQTNKQGKVTQHTQGSHFLRKMSCLVYMPLSVFNFLTPTKNKQNTQSMHVELYSGTLGHLAHSDIYPSNKPASLIHCLKNCEVMASELLGKRVVSSRPIS